MSSQDKIVIQLLRSSDILNDSSSDLRFQFDGEHVPKLPEPMNLELGEIALNIAKDYEVIAIKNDQGEIVYLPFNVAIRLLDVEDAIEQISGITTSDIEELSATTIALYENLEEFKVEINKRISETISRANNAINHLCDLSIFPPFWHDTCRNQKNISNNTYNFSHAPVNRTYKRYFYMSIQTGRNNDSY